MGPYLLIGAAGLVGGHLRRALHGREVVATYHRLMVAGAVALDITDRDAVRRLVTEARPGTILLAAADPYVERCEREPAATRRVNVDGTRHVAEAAAEVGSTLVVFSSEYVFDGTRGSYAEEDATGPLNEYGRQKVELEQIAKVSGPHLICRTSGVFGLEEPRKNFVLQLVDALRAGRPFPVAADQIITATHAASLGRAVVELLDRGMRGTFHVAGPERLGRADFARRVAWAFGLDPAGLHVVRTSELGLAAQRPLHAGLLDDKLRTALGHGLMPVDDALRDLALEARL